MSTLTPEQAEFLRQRALPVLRAEHLLTRRIIEAIPTDRGDYRPDPISKSALDLAKHVALAENRLLDGVVSGGFGNDITLPDSINNSADLGRWYGEAFERNIKRIESLSGEQLVKMVDFRGRFQWPAVEFLPFVISHSIHHRGQLSAYLRPMGAKVPSIYGESYDDAQARLAAQA